MTRVFRVVCSLSPPDHFARAPLASTNLTPPLPSPQAATDGHPRLERRQRLNGRRRPSCVCFRHTWRTHPLRRARVWPDPFGTFQNAVPSFSVRNVPVTWEA